MLGTGICFLPPFLEGIGVAFLIIHDLATKLIESEI
jgi:hypothetical protein